MSLTLFVFCFQPSKKSPALKKETESSTNQEVPCTAGVKTIDTSGIEESTEVSML
jgi:hypothetical protein